MANRKISTASSPRIVQTRPGVRLVLSILGLAVLGYWSWQVYQFGLRHGSGSPPAVAASPSPSSSDALKQQIATLESERDELRLTMARHERSSQIDREAVNAIRDQIVRLRSEREHLESDAQKLRKLVSDGSSEFQINDFALRGQSGNNAYRYSFVIARKIDGAKRVEGTVEILLAGEKNQQFVEVPLREFTSNSGLHKLGFSQHQRVEGSLRVPPGLTPSEFVIDVRLTSPTNKAFIISFDWI